MLVRLRESCGRRNATLITSIGTYSHKADSIENAGGKSGTGEWARVGVFDLQISASRVTKDRGVYISDTSGGAK
jgi:hypothetical protein